MLRSLVRVGLVGVAAAGTILWDGRFNDMTSSLGLNNWSWSDEVGPYQYYIHGSEDVTSYVNLDPSYKNPADSGSSQGVKITLDSTSYWNGQTMRRTELIPQTTAAINSGLVYYHFSIMHSANAPSQFREHQICFFESHFTEMKAGLVDGEAGTSDPNLRWDINSISQWNVTFEAGVWHNVAYEIDFSGGSVAFYHSTGSDDLTLTVPAVSVSASSDGEDWHLGVLELPNAGYADTTEDLYFSGVYVESGSLTTSVAGPGGVVVSQSSSPTAVPTTVAPSSTLSTSVVASPTATAAAGTVAEYGQCGGIGFTGATACVSPFVCQQLNSYYFQCLS